MLTHGCCHSKTNAHLCKTRTKACVTLHSNRIPTYPCGAVLERMTTPPSSAHVASLFGLLRLTHGSLSRSQRGLFCCGQYHEVKTRTSVIARNDLHARICPASRNRALERFAKHENPALGRKMDLLCTSNSHHRRDGLRCSSLLPACPCGTVCMDMCICTDHDLDWTFHRMAPGKVAPHCHHHKKHRFRVNTKTLLKPVLQESSALGDYTAPKQYLKFNGHFSQMATAWGAMVNLARTRFDALSLPLPRVMVGAQRQLFVCCYSRPLLNMIQRIVLTLLATVYGIVVSETRCNRFAAHRSKSATSNNYDDHHTSGK